MAVSTLTVSDTVNTGTVNTDTVNTLCISGSWTKVTFNTDIGSNIKSSICYQQNVWLSLIKIINIMKMT